MVAPNERRGRKEISTVPHQIPITREATQTLQGRKVEQLVLQNLVRRMRIVDHLPFHVVPHNRRAAQAFENPDLNFLRAKRDELIKASTEAFQGFAGQSD